MRNNKTCRQTDEQNMIQMTETGIRLKLALNRNLKLKLKKTHDICTGKTKI